MIRLALAALRHRPGAYAGAYVASLLAIALLSGGGLLLSSVLTAEPPADRFAATPLVVSGARDVAVETVEVKHKHGHEKVKRKVKTERLTGAGVLPAELAARLRPIPGVARVVPDAAFPLTVTDATGHAVRGADEAPVVGHGWASAPLTPFLLRSGQAPGPGQAVVDADLAARAHLRLGSVLNVTSRTGVRRLRVSGIAAPAHGDALPAQGAVFIDDDEVAAVSGLAGPTAVGVLLSEGSDPTAIRADVAHVVEAVARDADVLTGDDRVRADLPSALPDYIGPISIFGFVIGITAFAALFVLAGTVTLQVRQRLRDLALLRSIGGTPQQLRRLLALENATLALLAAIPGLVLGVAFAHAVAARFQALGAVPAQFVVTISVPVWFAAAGAGVALSLVAALIAARRLVRIAPTQALAETATPPTDGVILRLLAGAVTAGGAIAVLRFVPLDGPFGMGMSFISSALLVCTVAALGPLLVRAVLAVAARPFGLAGMLARGSHRRVSAVVVPLVLMFAINAPILLASTLSDRIAREQQALRTAPADAQVSLPGGMPLSAALQIAAAPGVTGAATLLPTRVVMVRGGKPQDYAANGLMTAGSSSALDLGVASGRLGDGVGVSAWLAKQQHLQVGSLARLWLADGHQVRLQVDMVYSLWRGFGDVVLPADLVAAHDARGLVSTLGVRADPAALRRLEAARPALRIQRDGDATAASDASDQQGAWELLVAISVGFTAIAVVNTFALAAIARRREYADLRLAGATAPQLHRLALVEAGLSCVIALSIGGAVAGIVVGAFSHAQDGVTRWLVDPLQYGGLAGAVVVLGLVAGTVPTRLMLRSRQLAADF